MDDPSLNSRHQVSDELINAFIDRQITNEERVEILSLIKRDKTLANRICELKQLKEMTQQAFDSIPQPPSKKAPKTFAFPPMAAAIAIFSAGMLIGLGAMQIGTKPQHGETQALTVANKSITKVLVHLTSSEVESALNTLYNLQLLLEDYRQNQQAVLVEVVANGDGINLLSTQKTAIAERIAELTRLYDNLTFAACKNTIDQMRVAKGLHIDLIPQVKLIDSGVVQVIQRQREGWTYIRG